MILLYTGAEKPNFPQKDPNRSLGGYISGTTIPNSFLNNLFGKVGREDIQNKVYEVRCIALKNITPGTVENTKIYTIIPESAVTTLKFAVVQSAIDPVCNAPYFESIQNGQAMPWYADFQPYEGIDNAFILPTLASGDSVGIWMLREIADTAVVELQTDSSCAELVAQLTNPQGSTSPPKEDILQMIITF
jgi:hypothetical protein